MIDWKNAKRKQEIKNKIKETRRIENLHKASKSANATYQRSIKRANKSPKGIKIIPNKPGDIINVKNVNKTYSTGKITYEALKDVNLSIKKGAFVVILGQSGSGKTTLLNMLSGLDRATSGDIVIKDTNISALTTRQMTAFRRNNVGFIFQSYNLLNELNAKDNAEMGRQLQIHNNKRLDVDELFEQVGLGGKQKKSVAELSGGELQRVSIIRALSKNPALIFADEPTGALDSKMSQVVIDLFKEINKKYKTTIVLVTHNEDNAKYASQVIRVKDGKVNVQAK